MRLARVRLAKVLDSYDLSSVQKPFLQHPVAPSASSKTSCTTLFLSPLVPPFSLTFPFPHLPPFMPLRPYLFSPSSQIPFNSLIDSIDGGLDGDTPPVVSVLPGLTKSSYLFSQNQMENIVIGMREEERKRNEGE